MRYKTLLSYITSLIKVGKTTMKASTNRQADHARSFGVKRGKKRIRLWCTPQSYNPKRVQRPAPAVNASCVDLQDDAL